MKAAEIGRRFVDFFVSKGHTEVPSASLLYNDPTLLFVNAGMVPFKPYLMGELPAPWKRATSIQKCVRTLDIEEVGKTTRHGTFFQMLGNFSFGDYFKKEAIEFAWELVTGPLAEGRLGFDPNMVWVTVLGPGFHPDYPEGDTEARDTWLSLGVPPEHIQGRGLKDNYWHMGVPGPGGPCSEIYIDRGPKYGAEGGPEADEDRFLEIWNLVFETEELSTVRSKEDFDIAGPMKTRNIDTGAGLERIALLMQGVDNMYETDEVFPVIERAAAMAGKRYGADHTDDVRLRVVGDHVRSSLMLMTDGVTPGNEARGYVLRRLMRRTIRSMRLLGVEKVSLTELLDVSRQCMHATYPEIDDQWERIKDIADNESESFERTLNSGTQLFDMAVAEARAAGSNELGGDKAFQLHDTYGFPIDLTLEMASEQGLHVDETAFRTLMDQQKARAKADAKAKKGNLQDAESYRELRDRGETPFVGYSELTVPTRVRGLVADGHVVDHLRAGKLGEVVLEETPFYAEMGGQDADAGVLRSDAGEFEVIDVQRPVPGLVVHTVRAGGELRPGDEVQAMVDAVHRQGACQAHSATHIIHAALRELVGPTATQAGSYNKPGYLRFDFNSSHGLSAALKAEIEARCNAAIRDDLEVSATQMPLAQAKGMGAMAMFGEKYPDIVRVVEMGGPWSRELCAGTHVLHASQIGMLNLLGEQSVGAGTRRVEALVSTDAFEHMAAERALVNQLTGTLKVQPDQLTDRVGALIEELKVAQKQIAELKAAQLLAGAPQLVSDAKDMWGVSFASKRYHDVDAGALRTLAGQVRDQFGDRSAVVALVGGSATKPALVVATTRAARDRGLNAGALVREGAGVLGGNGGGKPDLAQGGGTDAGKADEALRTVEYAIGHVVQG
ncbi:alanine--tRNA ligase [Propionibacterium freudenreichii]|uniref:alanine--tRNA ligase n=1 Tax=Propionibacterium freudenreichii TaxID=1744 RepID=UPI0005420E84|nr:alanine--tRNA ligase [Propionibacterium freudenreichii]WBF58771.1 alanine--tRNA ligase [Propionibacterium freudenreichii]WBF61118.1 alanine--tRNA ligase [Propionibacterium freudenreichii]WBF64757.1 alanine--tRNA ligase [Propionibacterium freudenreichii]CEH09765.1 Alanyl-tRNA synthetase (Alanine--tRNA ligase) (AlaRS) [Propionibacterium freudenreichii]SBW76794.1 Alanyl-tRNA synthetase AlaS [Propionibacterium freudenreichii]